MLFLDLIDILIIGLLCNKKFFNFSQNKNKRNSMQTIDSFLNMTNSNYIPNIIKPDIVFNLSNGIGSDIIYLPEAGNLSDFFFSQKLNNMVRTEQIIIPPRMLLSGETIINTKYYEDLRKTLKGFVYSKIVTKLKDKKRSRYFDTTPLVGKMVSISNKKTVLNVYNEFFQKVFSIYTDFDNSIENKDKINSILYSFTRVNK